MENEKTNTRQRLRRLIAFLVMAVLVCALLVPLTYLFRNTGYERSHITGIKREGPLDMVYIGGSAAFVFWQPLKAWNDCGFTSYNYATNSIDLENIRFYIREVLKTHRPELFVIGIRSAAYWDYPVNDTALRNGADSMDISLNRMAFVYDYLHKHSFSGEEKDAMSPELLKYRLPYYLELMKYHSNYDALSSEANWLAIGNRGSAENKGWEWIYKHKAIDTPSGFVTDELAELPEPELRTLRELMDFCKAEGLKVLFAVCPYSISREDYAKYNTVKAIAEEYGFGFFNANDCLDDMGIDFATDFYNPDHVNCFGAEKYTAYLEKYITEHYNLPDHRSDAAYASWDAAFARFSAEEKDAKERILALMNDPEQ